MYKNKKIYAVYRCLYGEDFIKESIESIIDYVDKVFVLYSKKIWGNVTSVVYEGEIIEFPKPFDNLLEKVKEIKSSKIILLEQGEFWTNVPWNNYTSLINGIVIPKYGKPDVFVLPEADHVFAIGDFRPSLDLFYESDFKVAKTQQIELWKSPNHCLPYRERIGVVFWRTEDFDIFPNTHGGGQPTTDLTLKNHCLPIPVYNLGFMVSEKSMYWKILTAIAFAEKIRDSPPNLNWYKNTWLNWDFLYNNKNLEPALGYEKNIPEAIKYENCRLPLSILERF